MSASETDGMLQIMLVNSCPAPKVQKREAPSPSLAIDRAVALLSAGSEQIRARSAPCVET
jgi:hypothetical protein